MTWRAARDGRAFVLPPASAYEAALVSEASIYQAGCSSMSALTWPPAAARAPAGTRCHPPNYPDLAEVKGQAQAKRALEVRRAGGHSVLMSGARNGKSMLAARFPGLLPPMTARSARIGSAQLARLRRFAPETETRPFRAPRLRRGWWWAAANPRARGG